MFDDFQMLWVNLFVVKYIFNLYFYLFMLFMDVKINVIGDSFGI